MIEYSGIAERHQTVAVKVGNVTVGGGAPVVVQSMTNTDTADVEGTARQVAALARAGSELVRVTVDRDEAAAAVPHIKDRLLKMNVDVPIIGDFHYIGHKLLADHPACAEALDKYRINPGNVGFKEKKDRQFGAIVETAIQSQQAGAHRRQLGLARSGIAHAPDGRERAAPIAQSTHATSPAKPWCNRRCCRPRAPKKSACPDRIIISAKVSAVQDLIARLWRTGAALATTRCISA